MRYWSQSECISHIRNRIDETDSSNSNFSDAQIVDAANRILEKISQVDPVYRGTWTITGDGSTLEFKFPDAVWGIEDVTKNDYPVYEVPYRSRYFNPTWPILQNHSGYRFYRRPDGIGFTVAPDSNDVYKVYVRFALGNLRASVYSTGTVSITNDSATVTGSGTTWTTNASAGDAVTINGEYYVIKTVSSNTSIVLTENVREATASGLSYEIGGQAHIPLNYRESLTCGTVAILSESYSGLGSSAGWWARYQREMLDAGRQFNRLERTGGSFSRSRGKVRGAGIPSG